MKSLKTILLASAISAFLATTASAELNQFYSKQLGQWTVEGFNGDIDFCSAKTYWDNGSYISLFSVKNQNTMSLYVYNTDWNITDPTGRFVEYKATIHFSGNSNGRDSGTIDYELVDNQTVILLDVNSKFIENWISYSQMEIVMPGNIGRMLVGLDGTRDLTPAFAECIEILEGKKFGT